MLHFDFVLTDFLRLEVLIQEKTIAKLQESVKSLTILNRKCDRQSRKNRKFLQTLIEQTKTDNVPLTEDQCSKLCNEHKVKGADCDQLCISKRVQCAHWPDSSKCLKHTGKGSNRRKKRHVPNPTETTLSSNLTGCLQNRSCIPDHLRGIFSNLFGCFIWCFYYGVWDLSCSCFYGDFSKSLYSTKRERFVSILKCWIGVLKIPEVAFQTWKMWSMWRTPVIFLFANGAPEPTAEASHALKILWARPLFASKKPVPTITFSSAKILPAKRVIEHRFICCSCVTFKA